MDISTFLGGQFLTHLDLAAPSQNCTIRDVKQQLVGIDGDAVAFLNKTDCSSDGGFGSDMAHHQAIGPTAEAPIGDQSDLVAKALSHDR